MICLSESSSIGIIAMTSFNEAVVEQAALNWLARLGWRVAHGPDIAPGTPGAERDDYSHVVLER